LEGQNRKFKVEVKTNTYFREIYIDDYEDVLKTEQSVKSYLIKFYKGQTMTVNLRMKGVGLSFVDSDPKEVLYISFYKMTSDVSMRTFAE